MTSLRRPTQPRTRATPHSQQHRLGVPETTADPSLRRARAASRTKRHAVPVAAPGTPRATVEPHTTILLAAYNEQRGLAVVLEKLRVLVDDGCEILVVDDGSTDATATVAEGAGARVVRHDRNRGKGAAIRTGVEHARGVKTVMMDADDTYPIEAIPAIIDALDHYEIVEGVRDTGRTNISPFNRAGNNLFRRVISLAAKRSVADPLTGLYGLRTNLLRNMNLTSEGFGIEAEIVIKAGRLGASLAEVPIDYRPRIGASKLNPVRDGLVILRTIASLALSTPAAEPTPERGPVGRSGG